MRVRRRDESSFARTHVETPAQGPCGWGPPQPCAWLTLNCEPDQPMGAILQEGTRTMVLVPLLSKVPEPDEGTHTAQPWPHCVRGACHPGKNPPSHAKQPLNLSARGVTGHISATSDAQARGRKETLRRCMFGCMLVLMKDRFEAKIPKPLDFGDISEVWEGPQRGTGRRCGGVALAERKGKPGATHTHEPRSCRHDTW